MAPPASAPAWRTGAVACRDDPMIAVPHPTRFVVVANCSTVSGTVRQVRRDPADGELNLLIAVDQRYTRFLLSGNERLLRAAVVPRDVPKVRVPEVGQHATLYGAWVLDRNQRNQFALHPVWGIEAASGDNGAGLASLPMPGAGSEHGSQQAVEGPPEGASIGATGRSHQSHGPRPVRRQGDPPSGTRGQPLLRGPHQRRPRRPMEGRHHQRPRPARVSLVALEHPGSFRVWLYVDKPGRSASVEHPRHRAPPMTLPTRAAPAAPLDGGGAGARGRRRGRVGGNPASATRGSHRHPGGRRLCQHRPS